jgi:HEAT repeat protein
MAKARSVDAKLTRLRALRNEPDSPAARAELRDALGDKSNFVSAAAAEIVGERQLTDLAPDLVAAFHRFLVEPAETDKICRAKIALTEALNRIEYDEEDVFRLGLRHVQPEPRWGGADDTAAPLRGAAAFALVRLNPRDLMLLLADLLADPEKVARSAAVRALGGSGALAAIPLLRFKARGGDEEPEVAGECLAALMTADPDESVPFVGQFLASPTGEVAEAAALALAESRRPDALTLLQAHWPKADDESLRRVLLLAVAITRLPAGLDFLLDVLAAGDPDTASAAVSALAIHRHNPAIRERVAAVVAGKGAAARKQFEKEFRADDSQ